MITVDGAVREGNSFELYFDQQLTTAAGTVVVRSMITSATLTITLKSNRTTIVNNREDLDVADNFNEQGEFRLALMPADAVILSPNPATRDEWHVATLTVVIGGAEPQTFVDELHFKVVNLDTVQS